MSQRIRIGSMNDEKGGIFVQVLDADTSEPLEDLTAITIKFKPDNVVVADVSYNDGTTQECYVEKVDAIISGDAVEIP